VILYHGSTLAVSEPKIICSEYGRDFGFGFYTTDIYDQARRWARRKARIARRRGAASAVVTVYDFDESHFGELSVKRFFEPDIEWLELVCACRSDLKYVHGFDIVIGKIANDDVGETVSYVVQGVMRKEDAVARLKFEKINNQVCFCTEKALSFLHYKEHEEV
jgi:hypothetical protein